MREICFTNNNTFVIELIVEPAAEAFDLEPEQTAVVEIAESVEFSDSLEVEHTSKSILIYEGRQMSLKIYIDGELIYYTDYS